MALNYFQVDTFTDHVFGGNPAVVIPLSQWLSDDVMQQIATEHNLSETVFFVENEKKYAIRWFTPSIEVDLCGHATLAAAYIIFNEINPSSSEVLFSSKSGELKVTKKNELLYLDFPSRPPQPITRDERIANALGGEPKQMLMSRDVMVVYQSQQDIECLEPDFQMLINMPGLGVMVTAPGEKVDFVARFFAPKAGILEDPVTGSAYCTLIPYWSNRLNKTNLHAKQLSKRRGELVCELANNRVLIGGKAVLYAKGIINCF